MIDTTVVVVDEEMTDSVVGGTIVQREVVQRLSVQAKEQDVDLMGPDGLLSQLTKNVVETTENAELTEHFGREYGGILNG